MSRLAGNVRTFWFWLLMVGVFIAGVLAIDFALFIAMFAALLFLHVRINLTR